MGLGRRRGAFIMMATPDWLPRKKWGQLAARELLKSLGLFFSSPNLKTLIFQSSVMFSKLLTELSIKRHQFLIEPKQLMEWSKIFH